MLLGGDRTVGDRTDLAARALGKATEVPVSMVSISLTGKRRRRAAGTAIDVLPAHGLKAGDIEDQRHPPSPRMVAADTPSSR